MYGNRYNLARFPRLDRKLAASGVFGTPAGDTAVAQHQEYMRARQQWADEHGLDDDDVD
jgi:hypothetical protein